MAASETPVEKSQIQCTVALVRPEQTEHVLQLIRDAGLNIVFDKTLVSSSHIKTLLAGDGLTGWTDGQPVHAYVLEGPDAIRSWNAIAEAEGCYGSPSAARARRQATYIQGLPADSHQVSEADKKPAVRKAAAKPKTTSRQSPPGRTAPPNRKPPVAGATTRVAGSKPATTGTSTGISGRQHVRTEGAPPSRVPVRSGAGRTATASSSSQRLSTTGGVSKPPKSVITGRPRRSSRVEKRKDAVPETLLVKPDTQPTVKDTPVTQDDANVTQSTDTTTSLTTTTTSTATTTTTETTVDTEAAAATATVKDDPPLFENQLISTSTSHKDDGDRDENEHDAEVAATTARPETDIPVPVLDRTTPSARASFSPNSVSSLPRPETPEVDHLRLRFETLAQVSLPVERPKSVISPELALKVKEMKPKSPAGARVKSMVEFFMDENLHKWEF